MLIVRTSFGPSSAASLAAAAEYCRRRRTTDPKTRGHCYLPSSLIKFSVDRARAVHIRPLAVVYNLLPICVTTSEPSNSAHAMSRILIILPRRSFTCCVLPCNGSFYASDVRQNRQRFFDAVKILGAKIEVTYMVHFSSVLLHVQP